MLYNFLWFYFFLFFQNLNISLDENTDFKNNVIKNKREGVSEIHVKSLCVNSNKR